MSRTFSQDRVKEQSFFDQLTLAKEYDVFHPKGYDVLMKCLLASVGREITAVDRILDLGCGSGAFIERFYSRTGAKCFGIDISENAIQWAKKKNNVIGYAQSDMAKLCFKENSFDIVLCSGSLHHFSDLHVPLKEAYRVLKKGGILISFDPNRFNPWMWLYRAESSPIYSAVGKSENERFFSSRDVYSAVNKTGFNCIQVNAISGVPFKYVSSSIIRFFLPIYNFFDLCLSMTPFVQKLRAFLVVSAIKL